MPVATNRANPSAPDTLGRLGGSSVPFTAAKLQMLYGDTDGYLGRFAEAARTAASAGVILPQNAEALVAGARSAMAATDWTAY